MDINQAFVSTCKILFGEEIGSLSDFADYLNEMVFPYTVKKSSISGKEVMISLPFYPENAKFISQDEISLVKPKPFNVNDIKDIDSLFSAIQENVVYCGNKILGTNNKLSNVDNCINCSYLTHAHKVYNVKYGAYLSSIRDAEHVFGVSMFPGARTTMRSLEGIGANRCFETYFGTNLSDTYYVFNCIGCTHCMFSFNLRSKSYRIGNLELPRDRYLELRNKLVSEIADELKTKKRIFSIVDIAHHGRETGIPEERRSYDSPCPPKVEQAFRDTTRVLLGKEHRGIRDYGPWLLRNAMKVKKVKGALGSPTYKIEGMPVIWRLPADRLVTLDEGMRLANEKHIQLDDAQLPTLNELLDKVARCAYFSVEFVDGQNENCVDTPAIFTGINVYKLLDTTNGKNSAYSTIVARSEHVFGGFKRVLDSQFCINCYDVTNVKGGFEVDCSYSSRNSYFCHNCENMDNAIFCFNVKSMSYVVGNIPVGKEQYARIKKILLDYINKQLDEKKGTDLSIFSIPKPTPSRPSGKASF